MTIMEKIKETINKLPFNGLVGKIPALAKVAGFANYAACALGVLLLVVVVAVATPNKASAQTKGNVDSTAEEKDADKKAKSELKELESQIKKTLGVTPEELVALVAVVEDWEDEDLASTLTWYEMASTAEVVEYLDDFDIGDWPDEWLDELKSYKSDAKKRMSAVSKEKDKLVKKRKERQKKIAEAKSMSVDKLKKQAPSPEEGFEVKPTDDSFTAIVITKYNGSDPVVVIPATIQGLPVKQICYDSFSGNNNLVAVVIPEGVTVVDGFWDCKNLSSVVLPSTLKVIDAGAFHYCSSLKSIDLPEGLMYIGRSAFCGSGLTSVKLPKSLRLLGEYTFGNWISRDVENCDSLAEIHIPEGHKISMINWDAYGNILAYDKERSFEYFFIGTKINESIALQKMLKETKTRAISKDECMSILDEIVKEVGAKKFEEGCFVW